MELDDDYLAEWQGLMLEWHAAYSEYEATASIPDRRDKLSAVVARAANRLANIKQDIDVVINRARLSRRLDSRPLVMVSLELGPHASDQPSNTHHLSKVGNDVKS
jgi:hypothetical protein